MNENQRKQIATILTTVGSIIASAVIAGIIKRDINLGLITIIGVITISTGFYLAAVVVLKKEQSNVRSIDQ